MDFKHELSPSKPLLRSTQSLILGIAVLERLDMTPVLQQSTRTKGFEAISCAHPVTLELRPQRHLQQVFVPWHCR